MLSPEQRANLFIGPDLFWPSAMVRSKVPLLDQALVDAFVKNNLNQLLDMGKYEHISKSQGCDGSSLAQQSWLPSLIAICPTLEFASTTLFKKELLAQLVSKPSVNSTSMRGDLWAAHRGDRILTVCYHMRKLKRNQFELQRLASTTTGEDFELLKQYLDNMMVSVANEGPFLPALPVVPNIPSDGIASLPDPASVHDPKDSSSVADSETHIPEGSIPEGSATASDLFSKLYPEAPIKPSTPVKKNPIKKTTPVKTKFEADGSSRPCYRKEYYKATNSFGFKRHCKGMKSKQIFSLGSKKLAVGTLEELALKVLASLNGMVDPSTSEEHKIELLAKFKLQKLEQSF